MCLFPHQICDRKVICPDAWDENICGKFIKYDKVLKNMTNTGASFLAVG